MTQRDEREKLAEGASAVETVGWAILQALHEGVEDGPQSWSDMASDQERRIKKAAIAAIEAVTDLSQYSAQGFSWHTLAGREAHAEIQRLQDAKRRALALADERAKENLELRAALLRVSESTPDNDAHYFGAIKIRLEALYELTSAPNIREHISDEIDWVNEKLGDPAEPADTPDEGPDPLGYAKGEQI